eukprot:5504830-Amphidinium_carterae.1
MSEADCDSEDHAPTVVADEGEYLPAKDGADAEGTVVVDVGSLKTPAGRVSEQQRLEVKRLLVDAEVACVSKAPHLSISTAVSFRPVPPLKLSQCSGNQASGGPYSPDNLGHESFGQDNRNFRKKSSKPHRQQPGRGTPGDEDDDEGGDDSDGFDGGKGYRSLWIFAINESSPMR